MNLIKEVLQNSGKKLATQMTPTQKLRLFGLGKIPLLFAVKPSVLELNNERCRILLPLNYITKNHLGSMYFGALAIGADCAGGTLALHHIDNTKRNIGFIFKSFHAEFLKRPENDVEFVCRNGPEVAALVEKVIATGERHHQVLLIEAFSGSEKAAEFKLELSLKQK